jgi:hypothetical protein
MKESDLALKFIEYFSEGYEVYKEVPVAGVMDMVVTDGTIKIGIEVKTKLSFKVIEQAFYKQPYLNYVYIAVPKGKDQGFAYMICSRLNIGVLIYNEKRNQITEEVKPKLNRNKSRVTLHEYMKESVAGSQNQRITAFGNTVNEITKYLQRHDGAPLEEVLHNVEYHWGSFTGAKASIYKWCSNGVIKKFRVEKGHVFLNKE